MKTKGESKSLTFGLAVVFTIVSIGAFVFSLWLTFDEIEAYTRAREDVAGIEARAARANALEARWRSVEPKAKNISGVFLSPEDLPKFFTLIEETAAAAGVTETTSIVKEEKTELTLRLRVTGPFHGLFVFVTHLNVLPTLLFVEAVNFNAKGEGLPGQSVESLSSAEVLIRVPLRGQGKLEEQATSLGESAEERNSAESEELP